MLVFGSGFVLLAPHLYTVIIPRNETRFGSSGVCVDGRGPGRGHFADGRRQALVPDCCHHCLRGCLRQNWLHDALNFLNSEFGVRNSEFPFCQLPASSFYFYGTGKVCLREFAICVQVWPVAVFAPAAIPVI